MYDDARMSEVKEFIMAAGLHPLFIAKIPVPTSDIQNKYIKQFESKFRNGKYGYVRIPCICGKDDDEIIGVRDRYGIKIHTVICRSCGLVRANPYYDDNTIAGFYKNEYDQIYRSGGGVKNFDSHFNFLKNRGEKIIELLLQHDINLKHKIIYEIGCAGGGTLKAFQDIGCTVKGADFNETLIKKGKEKGLNLVYGGIECFESDTDTKADIVIINHLLEHITRPIDYLIDLRGIIKDDGLLWVWVPVFEDYLDDSFLKFAKYNTFIKIQNAHVYYFTFNTLSYVLECAGYDCTKVNYGQIIARKKEKYRDKDDICLQEYDYVINLITKANIKCEKILYKQLVEEQRNQINLLSQRHKILRGIIKLLVNKRRYKKLKQNPYQFFKDSKSTIIKLLGVFYT